MPIHHTKFAIAKPHATGISTPQMPMPTKINRAMVHNSSITNTNATAKPTSQRSGVRRDNTIALILSVMVMNVYPGLITGGRSISVAVSSCKLIRFYGLCPRALLDPFGAPAPAGRSPIDISYTHRRGKASPHIGRRSRSQGAEWGRAMRRSESKAANPELERQMFRVPSCASFDFGIRVVYTCEVRGARARV